MNSSKFFILIAILSIFSARAAELEVKKGREIIQSSDTFMEKPLVEFPAAFASWQGSFLAYIEEANQICKKKQEAIAAEDQGKKSENARPTSLAMAHTKCIKSLKQLNLAYVDQVYTLKKWFIKARFEQLQNSIASSHKAQVESITKSEN